MNLRKIILQILLIVLIFGLLHTSPISAQSSDPVIITRENWGADEDIVQKDQFKFNMPEKIVVAYLDPPDSSLASDPRLWMKGLYYYLVGKRGKENFIDFPFHYIVTWQGEIFEGTSGGSDTVMPITGESTSKLIILYLSNYDCSSVGPDARNSLEKLILKLSNENSLEPESLDARTLEITPTDALQNPEIKLNDAEQGWQEVIQGIKANIAPYYNPTPKNYAAEIVEVTPEKLDVDPDSIAKVKIKIKNTGEGNFYTGSKSEILVTTDKPFDHRSKFYFEEGWASLSRATMMKQDNPLAVGEEEELEFQLHVPLFPGEQTEDFILVTAGGQTLQNTEFNIKLNVQGGNVQIVEVKQTETGYLNVRDNPGPSGTVIRKVVPGERYVLLEKDNSGWYKIQVDTVQGWVLGRYVEEIS